MPIRANQELRVFLVLSGALWSLLCGLSGSFAQEAPTGNPPGFYRHVLPILEQHCQSCHHAGGIAPMPFETVRTNIYLSKPQKGALETIAKEAYFCCWTRATNCHIVPHAGGAFRGYHTRSATPEEVAAIARARTKEQQQVQ